MNQNIQKDVGILVDMDWAPDFSIDFVARLLIEANAPATFFITNISPAMERLRDRPDLFELGVHPNFMEGTTQGDTVDDILHFVMKMVPDAVSVRTHGLFQSTNILARVVKLTPLRIDTSIYLSAASGITPVDYWWEGERMIRIPFVWGDELEWQCPEPNWRIDRHLANPGLQLFAFHPIHVFLNSKDACGYRELKKRGWLPDLTQADAEPYVWNGPGTCSSFLDLLAFHKQTGRLGKLIDIVKDFQMDERPSRSM